jgi:hypothetical protein
MSEDHAIDVRVHVLRPLTSWCSTRLAAPQSFDGSQISRALRTVCAEHSAFNTIRAQVGCAAALATPYTFKTSAFEHRNLSLGVEVACKYQFHVRAQMRRHIKPSATHEWCLVLIKLAPK